MPTLVRVLLFLGCAMLPAWSDPINFYFGRAAFSVGRSGFDRVCDFNTGSIDSAGLTATDCGYKGAGFTAGATQNVGGNAVSKPAQIISSPLGSGRAISYNYPNVFLFTISLGVQSFGDHAVPAIGFDIVRGDIGKTITVQGDTTTGVELSTSFTYTGPVFIGIASAADAGLLDDVILRLGNVPYTNPLALANLTFPLPVPEPATWYLISAALLALAGKCVLSKI